MTAKEIEVLIPHRKKTYPEFHCSISPYEADNVFKKASDLQKHRIDSHDLSVDEAEAQVPLTTRERNKDKELSFSAIHGLCYSYSATTPCGLHGR